METVSGLAEPMIPIEEKFWNLINLINLINFYLKAVYLQAARQNVTTDLSGVPLRRSFLEEVINHPNYKKMTQMNILCTKSHTLAHLLLEKSDAHWKSTTAESFMVQCCTMSYFQTHSVYYYYQSHGILHNPRGSCFVTGTQHIPLPPKRSGTNTLCAFPYRACWRCASLPECNLAGLLSLVSSVTLCSHSIRAPRLRGAADKILIILAHRIKGTRTEERGRRGRGSHTYIYIQTHTKTQIWRKEVQ